MKILSFPPKLSWYFIRVYGMNFLILLTALLCVIYIFDIVELLRRASKYENATLGVVLQMGLFKLPEVGQMIFPFAILFSAMWTFWLLTKKSELVVIRAAGLSVWQFILPLVLTAFIIGLLKIAAINPLSAVFISKYEALETQYISKRTSSISISEQGLWLRQDYNGGKAILHADKVSLPSWTLRDVSVYIFSPQYDFLRRIDADSSVLNDDAWQFKKAVSNEPGQLPKTGNEFVLPTNLSVGELESSFSNPQTISFWKYPNYIKVMEETGFDATPLKINFQTLLAQPLLFIAMVLLAASVSLRQQRLQGTSLLILSGIGIGFLIFFVSSFLQALGASGQISIYIAAWFPAIISVLLGITAMLILEDG